VSYVIIKRIYVCSVRLVYGRFVCVCCSVTFERYAIRLCLSYTVSYYRTNALKSCVRRLMVSVTTASELITDDAVSSRVITQPRRGRQPGVSGGAASTKRFPQFPPGATAGAAKAARAADENADHQRSVSLPVLPSSGSAVTTAGNDGLVTPNIDASEQQRVLSRRDRGELELKPITVCHSA